MNKPVELPQAVTGRQKMTPSEAFVETLVANGVKFTIASTLILRATANQQMTARLIDGNATVSTANGTIKAARTRIAMIELGGLVVRDVDALVLPDAALSENLLGMSFLSKLKRFEVANGKMVLEQ